MVLSLGLMVGYVALDVALFPPKQGDPNVAVNGEDDLDGPNDPDGPKEGDEGDGKEPSQDKGKSNGDGKSADAKGPANGDPKSTDPESTDPESTDPESTDPNVTAPPAPRHPPTWNVLGSYNGTIPGPHAITFTSEGGGIVRWELVERNAKNRLKYRDLSKKNGYLGVSAWERTTSGCTIRAIVPGSPASKVLQVGDELQMLNGEPLRSKESLANRLAEQKSGETIELTVSRAGNLSKVSVDLAPRPLELIRPERNEAGMYTGAPPSFLVDIHSINGTPIDPANPLLRAFQRLRTDHWKVESADTSEVVMSYEIDEAAMTEIGLTGSLKLTKHFRLTKPEEGTTTAHHIDFSVDVDSTSEEPLEIVLQMDGPNGLALEGWWYQQKLHPRMFKTAGARDVVCFAPRFRRMFRGAPEIYSHARKNPQAPVDPFVVPTDPEDNRDMRYIAVDAQYFSLALMGEEPGSTFLVNTAEPKMLSEVEEVDRSRTKTVNTTFRVQTMAITVAPGETAVQAMAIFAGPKRPEVLEAYQLDTLLEYGWFWYVAKPLAWVLHSLYAVVRNYGLAIILLTVLVRWLMLPFGRKAARNAMMMQELAPEMNRIKEKYKGDTQKLMEAQRELYKKYGFNPLSGCLPMLFQLPIFLGLYRALSLDINLRQAALIPGVDWCSNLAGPDQFWYWQPYVFKALGDETGWLGPYLNILPIATIVLFIIQQKMFTPPAQDEQQEMQQKIMKYMMIFIGVLFFKVPAGLCIYFITSSIWGIFERKLMPKPELKAVPTGGGGVVAAAEERASSPMEPSKASLVARERARQRRKGRKN